MWSVAHIFKVFYTKVKTFITYVIEKKPRTELVWLGPTLCGITLSLVLGHAQGCGMGRGAVEPIW